VAGGFWERKAPATTQTKGLRHGCRFFLEALGFTTIRFFDGLMGLDFVYRPFARRCGDLVPHHRFDRIGVAAMKKWIVYLILIVVGYYIGSQYPSLVPLPKFSSLAGS
jgi:hypothetical protein